MQATRSNLKVAWSGSLNEPSLSWLRERLSRRCCVTPLPELSQLADDEWSQVGSHVERLIVACGDRLSFAPELMNHLQARRPELPIALATSDWWNGASRTGVRTREILILPWYRWLDGWLPWLAGVPAEFFEPLPARLPYALDVLPRGSGRAQFQTRPATSAAENRGLVIAGNFSLAEAWIAAAESLGLAADWLRLDQAQADTFLADQPADTNPSWVLWDDSCVDTASPEALANVAVQTFEHLRFRWPHACRLAALTMPRWDIWPALEASGADELLAKPCTAAGLAWALAGGATG